MKSNSNSLILMITLAFFLSACNLGAGTPDAAATLNPLYTAAAQTLAAMSTQTTTPLPGIYPTTTSTLSFATVTPYKSPVPVSICNAAAFIRDVTIPDGSEITPASPFTKTWRMQNIGTCTWTPSYALIFVSGNEMGAPSQVNLSGNVYPGDTIDLTVNLFSPNAKGHYRGYWKLRDSSGVLFGIGAQADTAFWVDINVSGPEHIAYDFVSEACNADWRNNNSSLACPGSEGDDSGYVQKTPTSHMENGQEENIPGLLTVPKHTANGQIRGKYPAFTVQSGDRFVTQVNCQYNASTCNVLFRLEYQVGSGPIITIREWHEVYEGKFFSVDQDLSFLANQNVKFYLTVHANNSKGKDFALWVAPRILRQGTAVTTRTPTATSTTTLTPTFTATTTPTFTSTP